MKAIYKPFTITDMEALDFLNLESREKGKVISMVSNETLTDWERARLGKITGSNFNKIKRGKQKGQWSETAETYMAEIIWEWVTGIPAKDFSGSVHTDWGNKYEGEAIHRYEQKKGEKVIRGKFYAAKQFSGLVGCTPDGIGIRALEVKCPYGPKAHVKAITTGKVPNEYMDQVQGHMLCTGKEWCDFVSYDPRFLEKREDLAMIVIEVEGNGSLKEELENRLFDFEDELIKRLDNLEIPWRDKI